jgi:hypothetical protein
MEHAFKTALGKTSSPAAAFLAVTAASYILQGNEKRASRALVEGLCAALVVSALNDAHAPHPH